MTRAFSMRVYALDLTFKLSLIGVPYVNYVWMTLAFSCRGTGYF
ncbi:MAG: hypothetical protein ABSD92_12530 [Candidatus Bathyarchaeia archaeon]|jgi:hypothetical protein